MNDVIDLAARRAAKMFPPGTSPTTQQKWIEYENAAQNYVHVFVDYQLYFDRDETTDQERRNLAENLHEANDRLFDAAKAYDESFGTMANGKRP